VEQGDKLSGVLLHLIENFNFDINLGRAAWLKFYVKMGGGLL
jgi:hypothetical protein